MATLGILITTDRHLDYACNIAQAAYDRGHSVRIHLTGPGVRIAFSKAFKPLCTLATITICQKSSEQMGLEEDFGRQCPHMLTATERFADMIVGCDRNLVL